MARSGLQDGDRDGVSLLVVDLSCTDLLAEDAFAHNGCLVITCRRDQSLRFQQMLVRGTAETVTQATSVAYVALVGGALRTAALHSGWFLRVRQIKTTGIKPVALLTQRADALILMSTPAGRLSLFSASIVLAVA